MAFFKSSGIDAVSHACWDRGQPVHSVRTASLQVVWTQKSVVCNDWLSHSRPSHFWSSMMVMSAWSSFCVSRRPAPVLPNIPCADHEQLPQLWHHSPLIIASKCERDRTARSLVIRATSDPAGYTYVVAEFMEMKRQRSSSRHAD